MNAVKRLLLVAAPIAALAACSSSSSNWQEALLNPKPESLAKPAPDSFKVLFETSKGQFTVMAYRAWSPNGVDRFHYLVNNHFYDGARFFRTLPNFVVQFGINGDPKVSKIWRDRGIPDDPVKQSNQEGFVTYAQSSQPNSRTTQIFINNVDNSRLDAMGFAPFAKVIDGMHVVRQFYGGYGDGSRGGPDQNLIQVQGNGYLDRMFPKLDSVVKARVVK